MTWCFDLTVRNSDDVSKINFLDHNSNIILHIDYRAYEKIVHVNQFMNGKWSKRNIDISLLNYRPSHNNVYLIIEKTIDDRIFITCNGSRTTIPWVSYSNLLISSITTEGVVTWKRTPDWSADFLRQWRLQNSASGFFALNQKLNQTGSGSDSLKQGLSFIIRAKNEAHNVANCLQSISSLGDEIVFADNDSTDATLAIASKLKSSIFELKTFSYPYEIPRAGLDHAKAVYSGASNTLGHFYNWTLSRSSRYNFIKWDADYIAIKKNLAEMISYFNLRTRADNFILWFSGLEIYTNGNRYWLDNRSAHSEFRVFSRRHGHHWVNLPPWEEVNQRDLFRAQKLFYDKPVYLELFRLDPIEFRDRGVFTEDTRDRERLAYIKKFQETGSVPDHFIEVSSLDDPLLSAIRCRIGNSIWRPTLIAISALVRACRMRLER